MITFYGQKVHLDKCTHAHHTLVPTHTHTRSPMGADGLLFRFHLLAGILSNCYLVQSFVEFSFRLMRWNVAEANYEHGDNSSCTNGCHANWLFRWFY